MNNKEKFEIKEYNEKFYLVKWMGRQILEAILFFVIFVLAVQALVSIEAPINGIDVLVVQLILWVGVKIIFRRLKNKKSQTTEA